MVLVIMQYEKWWKLDNQADFLHHLWLLFGFAEKVLNSKHS